LFHDASQQNAWGKCDSCADDNGAVLEHGEKINLDDGCNSCTCIDNGVILCTTLLCAHHIAGIVVALIVALAVIIGSIALSGKRGHYWSLFSPKKTHNNLLKFVVIEPLVVQYD
jgi:hypothetical protein